MNTDLLNKRCAYIYKNGERSGCQCNRRITLKDTENNYSYCCIHYFSIAERRQNKKLEKLMDEIMEESDEEEKEKTKLYDKEELKKILDELQELEKSNQSFFSRLTNLLRINL